MDAARSWLTRHGDQLTVGQLAATARAALAITHYLGHDQMHLCPAGDDLTEAVVAAARPWRGVLQAVTELRSPVLAQADHSTLSVAATGVASWLRAQVRPDGHWRTPSPWAGDPTSAGAWRAAAEQITARMPDLANLLRQAIAAVHARGGVLAATGRLNPRSASLVHHPEWVPAPHDHRSYRALHKALTNSAARGLELVTAVGVAPHPGHDPARRHATTPISAAQLARAWYPQAGGIAEHALEPARGSMRSAASRAPDRRRTR